MKNSRGGTCECADLGCPVHECYGECHYRHATTLYRVDMMDETGVRFCELCAADAMEAGVFREEDGA